MTAHASDFIISGLNHLEHLSASFRSDYLNDELGNDFDLNSEDGDGLTLVQFISNIFEYIASAARRPSCRALLFDKSHNQPTELFKRIVFAAVYYTQITIENESNPDVC